MTPAPDETPNRFDRAYKTMVNNPDWINENWRVLCEALRIASASLTAPGAKERADTIEWLKHRKWGYWTDTPDDETKKRVTATCIAALSAGDEVGRLRECVRDLSIALQHTGQKHPYQAKHFDLIAQCRAGGG